MSDIDKELDSRLFKNIDILNKEYNENMINSCHYIVPKDAKCEEEFDIFYLNCFKKYKEAFEHMLKSFN